MYLSGGTDSNCNDLVNALSYKFHKKLTKTNHLVRLTYV